MSFTFRAGQVKVRNTEFKWEINMRHLEEREDERIKLISPKFCTGAHRKYQWEMWLIRYPQGDIDLFDSIIGIFLQNFNNYPIKAEFTFALISNDNKKLCIRKMTQGYWAPELSLELGFSNFCDQSFIWSEKNKILKYNKITISCEINMESECNIMDASLIDLGDDVDDNNEMENKLVANDNTSPSILEKLLKDDSYSDITIKTDEKDFHLHKCILAPQSPVFERMFETNMQERISNVVEIYDIKLEVLENFFQFLYTKKINDVEKIASELMYVAERYLIDELKQICEDVMVKNLNTTNVIIYLDTAYLNNAISLKNNAIKLIASNIQSFMGKPEFKKLGEKHPKLLFEIMRLSLPS